jgi:hypothetical protein
MDFLVHQIVKLGIQEGTVALILMLPLVATFIAFARQIIGIRGFGIYITLIVAYGFVAAGLKYGILIFLVVVLSGTLIRFLIRKVRIMYLPRMAIIFTGVSFAILVLFLLGGFLGFEGLSSVSIFPILIMTLIVERFVAAQIERGPKTAIFMTGETLLLAIISYFVLSFHYLQQIVLNYSLLSMAILVLINYFLGRWTGLRVSEYFRFRELIEYLELSSKKKK